MRDPVARDQAAYAIEQVAAEAELRRSAVEDLRALVRKADRIPEPLPALTATNPLVHSFGNTFTAQAINPEPYAAVRVAVLTVVLCYENLRDALQFDTWGGLQDATSLDERAQMLRGWLGTIAVVEMEAATACYDELAGA